MRGAKSNPLQFESDAITYPLCALGILQMVLGFRDAGSFSAAFTLLAQNPLLGGDPPPRGTWNDGFPLWTYLVGHIIGGLAVVVVVSLLLVPALEFRDPTIRKALSGKRDDLYGLFVTFTGLCGSAPLLGPLHKLFNERIVGHFYHDASLHGGLPYIALTLLLQLAVTETHFYWLHRAMHTSPWYELFHRSHHVFVPSIATASEAFHPIDLTLLAVGSMWLPCVMPVHHLVFTGVLFLNAVYTVFQHAGSRTDLGVWWLTDANTHGIHHDYGRRAINCGSLTSFWDHWCGTYRGAVPPWAVTKWPGKGMPAATSKKTDEPSADSTSSASPIKSRHPRGVNMAPPPPPSTREWLCHSLLRWL